MQYLTALLAFSAIMIVLSTLATVAVEGIHRLASRRTADFHRMLHRLYEDAVAPRLQALASDGELSAEAFAQEITRNPAVTDINTGVLDRIPVIRNLVNSAFDRLTTRQFMEQLAQTGAGGVIGRIRNEAEVTRLLAQLAYEFERYCEAATIYFERRATVFAVIVAFAMAMILNVDAIRLYSTLAQDNSLSERVVADLDISELERAYLAQVEAINDPAQVQAAHARYEKVIERVREDTERLHGLGLPIGHGYFPYCAGVTTDSAQPPADARCIGVATFTPRSDSWAITNWALAARAVLERVLFTQDGLGWLMSAILAGGMIGLGAPFWFRTYRYIATFIPGIRLPDSTLARRTRDERHASAAQVAEDATVSSSAERSAGEVAGPSKASIPMAASVEAGLLDEDLLHAFHSSRRDFDTRQM